MPRHIPVLPAETLHFLAPERGGTFVDCTVGLGGHAAALLGSSPAVDVIGLDRDPEALALAAERLADFGARARFAVACFDQLERRLEEMEIGKVSGILADLGVSSLQLEEGRRGFSFMRDGPLDMRMGSQELTAREIVNCYPEEELAKVIRQYGEERQARRIARRIVDRRRSAPIETTGELRRLIEEIQPRRPPAARRARIHPATRTFQALRIEVNRELDQLRELLDQAVGLLERDGRLVVISYQSLEDRIVKHTLRDLATGEIEPVTGRTRAESQVIEVLTRRPVRPGAEEVAANPRARSARLRAARRL